MKYEYINQLAIISMPIDKNFKKYMYQYYIDNMYSYDINKSLDIVKRIRQDILKTFYQIELQFLTILISNIINSYYRITYYSYDFYKKVNYISQLIEKIRKIDIEQVIKYITNDKDVKFIDSISRLLSFMPFINNNNYSDFIEAFKNDKKNKDIISFCNSHIISYIELSNNSDKMIIIPIIKFDNIFQQFHLESLLEKDSIDFNTEINFYTNDSFIKMYEYDYKNNKDLYIIDQFNER